MIFHVKLSSLENVKSPIEKNHRLQRVDPTCITYSLKVIKHTFWTELFLQITKKVNYM